MKADAQRTKPHVRFTAYPGGVWVLVTFPRGAGYALDAACCRRGAERAAARLIAYGLGSRQERQQQAEWWAAALGVPFAAAANANDGDA